MLRRKGLTLSMDEWKRQESAPVPKEGTPFEQTEDNTIAGPAAGKSRAVRLLHRLGRRRASVPVDSPVDSSADSPVDSPVDSLVDSPAPADVPAGEAGAADEDLPVQPAERSSRTDPHGYRRGAHAYAAPLGCILLVLALAGVVFLSILGVRVFQYFTDDTALRAELFDFLEPVVQYQPAAFTDVNDTDQNALLMAAIYRITEAERIRQLQQKTYDNSYPLDELGRIIVPVAEVEASYAYLFGPDAVPRHRTMGGEPGMSMTFEYDAAAGCYYVPMYSSTSMYEGVLDTLKKKGNTAQVRIGYVPTASIAIDNKGNPVPATPEQAEYFQTFTVQQTESGWMVVSASDREAP